MSNYIVMAVLALALLVLPASGSAEKDRIQETERRHEMTQDRGQMNEREETRREGRAGDRIYGWQLMSPAERQAHRQKMRSLKTSKEREAYRKEHHAQMQARAKQMGVEIETMRK